MNRFSFGGALIDVLIDGRTTAGEYALLRVEVPPGAPAFAEQHEGAVRVLFPLEGELRVTGRGAAFRLRPPDGLVLRAGEPYLVANATAASARYLLVCQPPHYERLVRETGVTEVLAEIDPTSEVDGRLLVAAAARLGIRLVDPGELPPAPPDREPEERIIYSMMGAYIDDVLGAGEHMIVARVEAAAGHRTPTHIHQDPICFCALQGEIGVYSGDAGGWKRLVPGQALFVPGRVVHGTRNDGTGPARFMVISTARTREFYHHFGMVRPIAVFRRE